MFLLLNSECNLSYTLYYCKALVFEDLQANILSFVHLQVKRKSPSNLVDIYNLSEKEIHLKFTGSNTTLPCPIIKLHLSVHDQQGTVTSRPVTVPLVLVRPHANRLSLSFPPAKTKIIKTISGDSFLYLDRHKKLSDKLQKRSLNATVRDFIKMIFKVW